MARYSESKDASVVKVCFEGIAKDGIEFLTIIGFEPNLSKTVEFLKTSGWELGSGDATAAKGGSPIYVTMIKRTK